MLATMVRTSLALATVCAALVAAPALAAAELPTVGATWQAPAAKSWLGGAPSATDAAGKVTVYWFCKPKEDACKDDLARIFNLREQGNVYVIAYIGGSKRDAQRLDPVRSEISAGAVAYGPDVTKTMAKQGLSAPMSVVVGTDGKVAHISIGGDPESLDARDRKIAMLVEAIEEFTVRGSAPAVVKPGERFELRVDVELSSWLTYDAGVKPSVALTVPPDVTCEATELRGDRIAIQGRRLTATVGCKGAVRGSYEARAALRFGYTTPSKAVGVGQDAVSFKFQIK